MIRSTNISIHRNQLHTGLRKCLLLLSCHGLLTYSHGWADTPLDHLANAPITLVQTDDTDCALKNGKLFSLQTKSPHDTYEIWVDRWFMQVKTPDHTRHIMQPGQPPIPLGCSNTYAGEQHWTIDHIKVIAP